MEIRLFPDELIHVYYLVYYLVMVKLLGYTDDAVRSLTKVVHILRVTHGHGTTTPFIKELILNLEEARAETSYKLAQSDA
ncbi:hypothetical protein SAY87_029627 [Trapa incisa]|uniref:Uncharacterized protein n=2 Tax=Trapa TaxID=22665 RepID=A0AAN7KMR3_TRANT|nr:hypothetical protein SAY87_029627 [Trapa incisa]KAK4769485.1 hypothetical protein SAY86_027635 [Trapa natans]